MGGGCSWCFLPNIGDGCTDLESVLTGLNTLAKLLSEELLLANECFLDDDLDSGLDPGLDPGGVGVGNTRTAPGILSGLTVPLLLVSPNSASSTCLR